MDPGGKKNEARGNKIQTVDIFVRANKQHTQHFFLIFGTERRIERMDAIEVFRQIHQTQPEVSTLALFDLVMGRRGLPVYFGSHGWGAPAPENVSG